MSELDSAANRNIPAIFPAAADDGEALLRVMLEAAPEGVAIFDADARFTYISPRLAELNNRTAEDHLGCTTAEISPSFDAHVGPHVRHVLENGEALQDIEVCLPAPGGENNYWTASYHPIRGHNSQILGVYGVARDVTASRRAEAVLHGHIERAEAARVEAETASRAKDEFLAVVSHELRTPLTSIRGWLHLLRSGRLDAETYAQGMEALDRSSRAQSQLIEDLLDASRIILGKLPLHLETLDLVGIIQGAVDAVRPAIDAREISLRIELDPAAGRVRGDPDRLQQMVWNLLSNAAKYTPHHGSISVTLRSFDGVIELRVADSGIGIDAAFLPCVFDRFRQADGSSTRAHNGLGLGLAIVRYLTEMHGGTVRAESAGIDKGSTFIVQLPRAASPGSATEQDNAALRDRVTNNAADTPGSPPIGPDLLRNVKVLVTEDDPDTRELLGYALHQYGAEVRTAPSADEGFAQLCAWRPDLLVSDIGMPGEDGYSLIGRVRALPAAEGGQTPAIALTAYTRGQDRVRILAAGFEVHVPKPVDPAELAAAISILTRRR